MANKGWKKGWTAGQQQGVGWGRGGRRGGGRPAAKDRGQRAIVGGQDGGHREQREGGRGTGGGGGNLALRKLALGLGACDWPRLAMVAGAASTEVH